MSKTKVETFHRVATINSVIAISLFTCSLASTFAHAELPFENGASGSTISENGVLNSDLNSALAEGIELDVGVTPELHALQQRWAKVNYTMTVSYTHLTLPTKRIV